MLNVNKANIVLFLVAVTFNTSRNKQMISGLQSICV